MREWLIWSIEHNAWWRPDRRGYTPDRTSAGRYTMKEALEIVSSANRYVNYDSPPNEAMIKYESK